MSPVSSRVWEVLQQHLGRESGIRCRDLARQVEATPRQVRQAVVELRLGDVPVCGHPTTGYFIAANKAELDETCAFLRERSMTSLKQEAALKRIPAAELAGQMQMELAPKEGE
jgi:hypothetical protein